MLISNKKKFVYVLSIVLSVIYLLWRVFFTIPWHAHLFTLIFALLLVGSELISNFTAFVLIIFRLMQSKKDNSLVIPKFDLTKAVPDIDVLIVTHNEDVELLRKTVNAATFMKYPDKNKVHVFIADDGCRPEVNQLADDYHVGYVKLEDNKQAKAGNINHALEQLHSPLFALFDTDMIPFSNFLYSSVPFFTKNWAEQEADPDNTKPLGFIQTPQSFYNADIFQFNLFAENYVANEQDFFSRDVNVLNGYNKTALFTGSNAVFLRQAIDDAGGFPVDTITEDFELGTKINMEGYISLATTQPVSSGITPVDVKGVIKQRTRWARGVVQSCRNLHIFTNPKLSMTNRIILINTYLYWWTFTRRLIYIIAPLLYALFKIQIVDANFWVLMIIWAPGYFLLHYVLGDASSKIRNERWGEIQETFFSPYLFIPVFLETIGIKARKFKVTEKNVTFSFKDRLYILPYLLLWILTLWAIIHFNYGKWGSEIIVGSVITFWLVTHFINLSFCLFVSMKRNIYRKSDRFAREAKGDITLTDYDEPITFKTRDVSEGGFSFELNDPKIKLVKDQTIHGNLYHDDVPIKFTSQIVRTVEQDQSATWYAATIEIAEVSSENHYLELIHDGDNQLLPKKQDNWITPLDELHLNVVMHSKNIERMVTKFIRSNS